MINDLKERIKESSEKIQKLEMDKELQNSEIGDYKMQINNLKKEIRAGFETIEQQKLAEARVDKVKKEMQLLMEKFTAEIKANALEHQKELVVIYFLNSLPINLLILIIYLFITQCVHCTLNSPCIFLKP